MLCGKDADRDLICWAQANILTHTVSCGLYPNTVSMVVSVYPFDKGSRWRDDRVNLPLEVPGIFPNKRILVINPTGSQGEQAGWTIADKMCGQ